jgi:CheY-like chemotaxis protein
MSHEIRTPLNGVLGLTELLSGTPLSGEQKEFVNDLQFSGETLRGIINDILDFSKIEAGKLVLERSDFDLHYLLDKLCSTFRYQAQQNNVELNFNFQSSLPRFINADPIRIRQIFTNLIGNAVKFTSSGSIEFNVTRNTKSTDFVEYIFEVKDTGIGISDNKLNNLYDKFTQGDMSLTRRYSGTGLGLTIVKELVDKMDGTIHVNSKVGGGTTFTVALNLKIVKQTEFIDDPDVEVDWERTPKILLAEDNPINQKVAIRFIEELECEVELAENGKQVMEKVAQKQYDLIFMDIQMPEMNGVEATKRIRAQENDLVKHTPIIALTAHALRSELDHYLDSGMDHCITKPVSKNKLCLALIKILSHLIKGVNTKKINVMESLKQYDSDEFDTERSDSNKEQVLLINFEKALLRLENNKEFFLELLVMFKENAKDLFDEMESALLLENIELLKHPAHSIKGVSAQISAEQLQKKAFDFEGVIALNNLNDLKLKFDELKSVYQQTINRIDEILEKEDC